MPPRRAGTTKAPGDLTGRTNEELVKAKEEQIDAEAQQLTMVQQTNARRRSQSKLQVEDFTDAARPKVEVAPVALVPHEPRTYRIRLLASIDRMTFGKEIIDPGNFDDPNNPRMPVLGSLKEYNFKEGREYMVDEPLYIHLRDLGYIYPDDSEYEDN
jgi:hypothetical protein